MNVSLFSSMIFVGSLLAGFLGALTGLGGGIVIVPMLALLFGVSIRYAIGASLVSVIATSSGAAAAYVKEGYSNIRLGMFLEVATTVGAVIGAGVAAFISTKAIAIIFGLVLLYSSYLSIKGKKSTPAEDAPANYFGKWLHLDDCYPEGDGMVSYHCHNIPTGFGLMWV
ncbi:MAG: sulfite exporter TauE/SafE family protein, partial [Syntrophobacteraceae bacterium]